MAFVNEYISEADYEKYDLRRVIGEQNPFQPGYLFAREWTIDRKNEMFLAKIWTHREAELDGYAFYWKGEWMFFEMRPVDGTHDKTTNACWFRFRVKGFVVPDRLNEQREVLMNDLRAAITAHPGGPEYDYSHRTATIDFIGE